MPTPNSSTVYTTIYDDLKGADFTNDPSMVYKKRSPSLLNMISDKGGNPKKRPGWKIEMQASNEKTVLFDGVVEPVIGSTYEICRLGGVTGTLYDTEMYVNGVHVKFNEFFDTPVSYFAKYANSSGTTIIYVVKNKNQTYASLYIKRTANPIIDAIHTKGTPYHVQIYQSPVSGGVRDMWSFSYGGEQHLICLIGKKIYRYLDGDCIELLSCETTASNVVGVFMDSVTGGSFYLMKDQELYRFVNNGTEDAPIFEFEPVVPYIPTVLFSRLPSGGGEMYESVNLLTRIRKESFLGDEESTDFYVSSEIDTSHEVLVSIKNSDGAYVEITDFTVDGYAVKFSEPKPPVVTGEDNVLIQYTPVGDSTVSEYFRKCQIGILYENKIFLSGSTGNYGSYVWYSAYDNPSYFPDLNYIVVGSNDTNVMGMVGLGEYLGIVKEADDSNNTIYLAYSTTLDEETAYACKQSISGVGAVSMKSFKSLGNEQLFLSKEGVCGLSAESVKNRSYYINKRLCQEPGLENAIAITWDGFYLLCVNKKVYILDSRQKTSWQTEWTNYLYECYYWENIPASAFAVYDGMLWFGTLEGSLCRFKLESEAECFNDNGEAIPCEWSTPFDNDDATYLFKTMMKKGGLCTIESMDATSVDAYLRADKEEEKYIGSIKAAGNGLPTEFHFNKKKKKYKRLQLIFRNNKLNEGLKINEIVKNYTIGNYSKNRTVT